MKMKVICIVLWSDTNKRHVQVKQLKIQKKAKTISEESELMYRFHGQSARSQCWFDIGPNWIEDKFITREPYFSKGCTLNEFQVKPISIGLHFLFQLYVQKKKSS